MRIWTVTLVIAFLAPAGVWAQVGNSGASGSAAGIPFGSGQAPSLSYSGQAAPSNVFFASLSSQTTYDDNVTANSKTRVGDVVYSLGPHFAMVQTSEHFTVDLDYQPYFSFYQRLTQFDRINQSVSGDVTYRFGSRVTFRLREAFSDQTGAYQPQPESTFVPGLGAPTQLNTTIYPPLLNQRDSNTRVDIVYQESRRTSLTLFGDYDQSQFNASTASTASVPTTQSATGGAQYAYRVSEHVTFGMLYLFQRMSFQGNLPAGSASQVTDHNALATIGWRVSPSVSLNFFGGPQYQEFQGLQEAASLPPGSPAASILLRPRLSWTAGGTVTKQSEKTALSLSASRGISNGGIWLGGVTSSALSIGISRHFMRRWDASCNLSYARNQYLGSLYGGGGLNSETLGAGLGHSLGERVTARLSYNFIQQQGSALPIVGESFGHNEVSLGVFYQLQKVPLGR